MGSFGERNRLGGNKKQQWKVLYVVRKADDRGRCGAGDETLDLNSWND